VRNKNETNKNHVKQCSVYLASRQRWMWLNSMLPISTAWKFTHVDNAIPEHKL